MTFSIRVCQGCGQNRLCRLYGRGAAVLWLCVNGAAHCYRRRKGIRKVRAV